MLRVQLAQYLIDWLGRRIGGTGSAYRYLRGPTDYPPGRESQERVRDLLRSLLDLGQTWKEFVLICSNSSVSLAPLVRMPLATC